MEECAALMKLVSQRQKNSRPIIEPICPPILGIPDEDEWQRDFGDEAGPSSF